MYEGSGFISFLLQARDLVLRIFPSFLQLLVQLFDILVQLSEEKGLAKVYGRVA